MQLDADGGKTQLLMHSGAELAKVCLRQGAQHLNSLPGARLNSLPGATFKFSSSGCIIYTSKLLCGCSFSPEAQKSILMSSCKLCSPSS